MTRLSKAFVRFQKNPSSVRYAAAAIIIEASIAAAHERLERLEAETRGDHDDAQRSDS